MFFLLFDLPLLPNYDPRFGFLLNLKVDYCFIVIDKFVNKVIRKVMLVNPGNKLILKTYS